MKNRVFPETRIISTLQPGAGRLLVALLVAMQGIVPAAVHAAIIAVNTSAMRITRMATVRCARPFTRQHDTARDRCIAGSGADVINLTGVAGAITLGGTELAISSNLTHHRPGADD